MKVLLVDDHALFRAGVRHALTGDEGIQVVGEASDGREAVEAVTCLRPDVVLMDLNMPNMNGVEATRRLKQLFPDLRIVILTVSDADRDLFEAIKAGADGYLLKSTGTADLAEGLRAAVSGESPISPLMAARLLKEFRRYRPEEHKEPAQQLSPREVEVLKLVSEGLTYKEVATRLFVAENTVKNHMRHIMEKLHLKNRSQAVGYAIREGIALPPESDG